MNPKAIESILSSTSRLGKPQIIGLAFLAVCLLFVAFIGIYLLGRDDREVLYTNLETADAQRIGNALTEEGIKFNADAKGTSIFVNKAQVARARMLLAERGLPNSSLSGYELFDKIGPLGMTSFLQEVTRVRAMEGELARTIQLLRGIKAARVHIVTSDEGSFRRTRRAASASVTVRVDQTVDPKYPMAIRRLVASSIPGMTPSSVTIIDSNGSVVSSENDGYNSGSGQIRSLEKNISSEISENISRTLGPYLNNVNFRVSVSARLNTDQRSVVETIFDPNTKVERSVKVIKENQTISNANRQNAITVERNIPVEVPRPNVPEKDTSDQTQKREEITNYEVSSKVVNSRSSEYSIDNISVAILINQRALQSGEIPLRADPGRI